MKPADFPAFRQALREWFQANARDYPWRRTKDPYAILVSEMMLQQTQVASVLNRGYYQRWLEAFPTPAALAAATEEEILRLWEGLGYYSRARNLQKAAQQVCAEHGGQFPADWAALRAMPGLGDYTAGAVATFAFGQKVPIVDANIARALSRLFLYESSVDDPAGKRQLWQWAEDLLPEEDPGLHNAAIMELGQRICINGAPQCLLCPVVAWCAGKARDPGRLPIKRPPKATVEIVELAAWTVKDGKLLLTQETGARRRGLWKLPERADDVFARQGARVILAFPYAITHYRVQLRIHEAPSLAPQEGESWHSLADLGSLPMPSPYRKAVEALRKLSPAPSLVVPIRQPRPQVLSALTGENKDEEQLRRARP